MWTDEAIFTIGNTVNQRNDYVSARENLRAIYYSICTTISMNFLRMFGSKD